MKIVLTTDGAGLNLLASPYLTEGLSLSIIGNKGSGKSHTLAVLAEEAHRNHLPFIYYDVNGDAASLRQLGDDVLVVGRAQSDTMRNAHYVIDDVVKSPADYIRLVLQDGFSLVVDLSGRAIEEKAYFFATLAEAHFEISESIREPVMALVDEAHIFAPQKRVRGKQVESLDMFTAIMSDGRKRGILLALATQRATYLNKDVLFGMNVRLFGKITWYPDFETVRPYLPPGTRFEHLRGLATGYYYIVSENAYGKLHIKPRTTPDLGGVPVIRTRRRKARPSAQQLQLFPVTNQSGGKEFHNDEGCQNRKK